MFPRMLLVSFVVLSTWTGRCTIALADRTLEHEAIVPAPVADVWAAFTTSEGFQSWAVPLADIDFRVGGDMRTSYNAQSNLNDEHTIVNRVLAYEPERMLAMQNVQAPAGLPNTELFQSTWSVIYFIPTSDNETRVRMVGLGYGEGPEWDAIYNMFQAGNAYSLDKLREKFAGTEEEPVTASVLLSRLVGGEWLHETKREDGTIFRARNVLTQGPDGVSIIGNAWLGDADGMFDHGDTIIYRRPGTGNPTFFSIDERGTIAQGGIQLVGSDTLHWDWDVTALDGSQRSLVAIIKLVDNDHYLFSVADPSKPESEQHLVAIEFTRVGKSPEAFRILKNK